MAAKRTAKKPAVTIDQLKAVAVNFNDIMFEEGEGIKFEEMEYDELLKIIGETAEQLEAADIVSSITADTLEALGIDCPADVEEPEESEEETEEEETEEEETEEEEETDEEETDEDDESEIIEDAIADVKKCRKLEKAIEIAKEFKIPVPPGHRKDLKKLKPYLAGKLEAKLEAEGEEVEEKETPQKEESAKETKLTIGAFFEKEVPNGLGDRSEDDVVVTAKKIFTEKPYRVIGNALYAYLKKLEK